MDSVAILAEFLRRGVSGALFGCVKDPAVVGLAAAAGVGPRGSR